MSLRRRGGIAEPVRLASGLSVLGVLSLNELAILLDFAALGWRQILTVGHIFRGSHFGSDEKFRECGMIETSPAGGRESSESIAEGEAMTLSRLRHDIRNYLNTIKLSTALLHRQRGERPNPEPLREIDKAADGINELVGRFMGDADAPGLFGGQQEGK